MERMLELDPDKRPTAAEALHHPYIGKLHDADDEPTADPVDMTFEDKELSLEQWKCECVDEISTISTLFIVVCHLHPQL